MKTDIKDLHDAYLHVLSGSDWRWRSRLNEAAIATEAP